MPKTIFLQNHNHLLALWTISPKSENEHKARTRCSTGHHLHQPTCQKPFNNLPHGKSSKAEFTYCVVVASLPSAEGKRAVRVVFIFMVWRRHSLCNGERNTCMRQGLQSQSVRLVLSGTAAFDRLLCFTVQVCIVNMSKAVLPCLVDFHQTRLAYTWVYFCTSPTTINLASYTLRCVHLILHHCTGKGHQTQKPWEII